jgi:galactonate dehydratase
MNQNRRKLITTIGAISAGQLFIDEHLHADSNPSGLVVDRSSTIRIKSLKATPVGPKVFLKIETNHGITGWGEIDQLEPKVAAALATSLFELLDGENPTRIEYLWQKLFRAHRNIRGGPFMIHTIAGIDMALWDITGKLWNTPVYRILGGPCRDKILVYPSIRATKPGAGPAEFSGTPSELQRYVDYIQAERKKVGPKGIVIFDAHCALPPPFLIQLANMLNPTDVSFIEEIAVPGNIEVFKRIKQAVKIPLASGERDRTIYEFLPYLQEKCLDVLQPDCAHCSTSCCNYRIGYICKFACLCNCSFFYHS